MTTRTHDRGLRSERGRWPRIDAERFAAKVEVNLCRLVHDFSLSWVQRSNHSASVVSGWGRSGRVWRNWQTHRSQKPVDEGSNPSIRIEKPPLSQGFR